MTFQKGYRPICPTCRQPTGALRGGVRLTRALTMLFDALEGAGAFGLTMDEMNRCMIDRGHGELEASALRALIMRLRKGLGPTDWHLITEGPRPYRWKLVQYKTETEEQVA